jgi:hypothetical protein
MEAEQKYAFAMPAGDRFWTVVNGVVGPHALRKSVIRQDKYTILDWPEDQVGLRVDVEDLADHVPAPPEPENPATVARLALLNSPEAQANPLAAELLANNPMPLELARAFLRGLPPSTTSTAIEPDTAKENAMTSDSTKQARLVEIKLGFLRERANNNVPGARALAAKVQTAKAEAEATGLPLYQVLAARGINL